MKNLLLIPTILLLAGSASFGQDPMHAKPAVRDTSVKANSEPFIREKFDPKRDPKPDLENAVQIATASGKRIILDIGGEWCGWCIYMDKFFYQNPELAKIRNDNFVWVKVNFSEENENAAFLSVFPAPTGYPHLYILDPAGKLLHSHGTSDLEKGDGYDLAKFTDFLRIWSPKPPLAVH